MLYYLKIFSDILICSICAPLTMYRAVDVKWNLGRLLCKLGPGLQSSNVIVTAFSITAIALDRWDFIANKGKNSTKKFIVNFGLFTIWILAFCVSIPLFIVNDLKVIQLKSSKEVLYSVCEEIWFDMDFKYIFSVTIMLFQYGFPVIVIASANFKIINFLRYHVKTTYSKSLKSKPHQKSTIKRPLKSMTNTDEKESVQGEDSMSKTEEKIKIEVVQCYSFKNARKFSRSRNILLLVSLSFIICWLPLLLFNTFLDFSKEKNLKGSTIAALYIISHLIAMTSCCINPVLYGLENTNFKQELQNMVTTYFSTNGTKGDNDEYDKK